MVRADVNVGWTKSPLAAALVAVAALACSSDDPSVTSGDDTRPAEISDESLPVVAGEWADTPDPPLAGRWDPAALWTGDHVVVWGGYATEHDVVLDGAFYDPDTKVWTPIPSAPVPPRGHQVAAWVDDRLVVWVDAWADGLVAGAAYDPDERRWTPVSPPPRDLGIGASSAATGDALFVLTADEHAEDPTPLVLAYDADADAWELLPRPPQIDDRVAMVSDGQRLYLWGCDGGSGAVFDPGSDEWRSVEPPPSGAMSCLSSPPLFPGPFAAGDEVLAWPWRDAPELSANDRGGTGAPAVPAAGAAFDPLSDAWRSTTGAPTRLPARAAAAADKVVVWGGGTFPNPPCVEYERLRTTDDGFVYSIAEDRWRRIEDGPLAPRNGHALVWTDHDLFVWGGAATSPGGGCDVFADGATWRPGS
jgi:hypothetical protein